MDRQTALTATLAGTPGYFIAPARWRVQHQQPLREHLIYYVVDGAFTAHVAAGPLDVQAGSVFWLRPGYTPDYHHAPVGRLALYRFRLAVPDMIAPQPYLLAADPPAQRCSGIPPNMLSTAACSVSSTSFMIPLSSFRD